MLEREWERFKRRAVWSWQGWLECWRTEASLPQSVWANVVSGALALLLDLEPIERALVLSLGVLILAAELMNTGIERAINYIIKGRTPAGQAGQGRRQCCGGGHGDCGGRGLAGGPGRARGRRLI